VYLVMTDDDLRDHLHTGRVHASEQDITHV